MQKNDLWKYMLVTLILSVAISLFLMQYLFESVEEHEHDMEDMHDMGNMMSSPEVIKEMMGTSLLSDLPLIRPDDRIKELSYITKEGVKEFELTADPIRWQYQPGDYILAWGFNKQVPGPEIRVREGDTVRIKFKNNLPKPTTIHWHGIEVPNSQDGVPAVTQKPIQPGETFTYEFVAKPAGTRFYHTHGSSHTDEAQQLDMGLAGAFIIEPLQQKRYDKEFVLLLDEWELMSDHTNAAMSHQMSPGMQHMLNYNLFTINGIAFPNTAPLEVKEDETILIRMINVGTSAIHPMHLHGHSFKIAAIDGNPVPPASQQLRDMVVIAPGERYDIELTTSNPGAWMLHCHELHHADAGMIAPFLYEGYGMMQSPKSTSKDSSMPHMMH